METKLTHILDDLSVEEVSQLLDSEFKFPIDKSIQKRIIKSTKKKIILDNEFNNSGKFKNALNFIFPRKKLAYAFTTFTLFIGLGFGSYAYLKTPKAYISLDINPSIELGINRFEKVVTSEAYNADGKRILDNTKYKYLKIESAVDNILASAIDQDYIADEKTFAISIATISNDGSVRLDLENKLKKAIFTSLYDEDITIDIDVDIASFNSNSSKREEARSLGVTVGKLSLIQELMSLSPDIKFDDYKYKSIIYIQNKIRELKNIKTSSNLNEESVSNPLVTGYIPNDTNNSLNSSTSQINDDDNSSINNKNGESNINNSNNTNNDNINNSNNNTTDNSSNGNSSSNDNNSNNSNDNNDNDNSNSSNIGNSNNGNKPNNKPNHGSNHKPNNKPNNGNANGNKDHEKHNNCDKGNGHKK